MQVQRFTAGVMPLQQDFNAIGENRVQAFRSLLSVFSVAPEGVLFQALDPVVALTGTVLSVNVPDQVIGVGGVIVRTPSYTETFDLSDGSGGTTTAKVQVYFVIRETGVSATRNFLSTNPTNNVRVYQALETEIATKYTAEVQMYKSTNVAAAEAPPATANGVLGYIKLVDVVYDGSTINIAQNTAAHFRIPGGASIPIAAHGVEHLPGGSDPIPLAQVDNTGTLGSTAGLMPEGALAAAQGGIQDIVPTTNAAFLQFATQGSNTIQAGDFSPKIVQANLNYDGSLRAVSEGGTPKLAVNFPAKTFLAGQRDQAARSDHTHRLSESGYVVINKEITVSSDQLGDIINVSVSVADASVDIEQILDVQCYFAPRNLDAQQGFDTHRLAVGWNFGVFDGSGIGTVGTRVNILGPRLFQLELGEIGLMYLSSPMQTLVQSWTSPSYSDGAFPKAGTLHLIITALRQGARG